MARSFNLDTQELPDRAGRAIKESRQLLIEHEKARAYVRKAFRRHEEGYDRLLPIDWAAAKRTTRGGLS